MSPLPTIRLDNPVPWSNVGVDYLGPLICLHECAKASRGSCPHPSSGKVWISIFTCMHTRSIHGEVVRNCESKEFLLAFRMFVAKKGRPNCFYSDNATTFTAADKELQELLVSETMDDLYDEKYKGNTPVKYGPGVSLCLLHEDTGHP